MLLVRTPVPYPTESLFGFMLRVSECNGYHSPSWIWEMIGRERWRGISYRVPITELASILGHNPQLFQGISYEVADQTRDAFKLLDHDLGGALYMRPLRLARPAFCPECVAEDKHIDAFWDLSAAVACPRHGRLVVWECRSCAKRVDWRRPGLLKCQCGANFSPAASEASPAVRELAGMIRARLHHGTLAELPNTSGLPLGQLWDMPLRMLLQLLETIGQYVQVAHGRQKDLKVSAVGEAASALEDWPRGYYRALAAIGEYFRKRNPKATSLRLQFGSYYEVMFKHGHFAKHAEFLKEEFLNFGQQHWGQAVVDTRMLLRYRSSGIEQRFMSLSQFIRKYGFTHSAAQHMIGAGRVFTHTIRANSGIRVLVDLERSQLPEPSSKGPIDIRTAAARAGLSVRILMRLIERGVLVKVPRREYLGYLHVDDVDTLLERTANLPVVPRSGGPIIHLDQLLRMKFGDLASKVDIVMDILNGTLPIVGRDGGQFSGLCVDRQQVLALIQTKKQEARAGTHWLSECLQLIGLTVPQARAAMKKGLLRKAKHNGLVCVTTESLNRFKKRYLSLNRVAAHLETRAGYLARKCREWKVPIAHTLRPNGSVPIHLLSRDRERHVVRKWKAFQAQKNVRRIRPGQIYSEKLCRYLDRLRDTGQRLPRRKWAVNRPAIAKACGVENRRFWKPHRVKALLAEFDAMERRQLNISEVDELEVLRNYLRELRMQGRRLPVWGGSVNRKAIAAACGISRHLFYRGPDADALLASYSLK